MDGDGYDWLLQKLREQAEIEPLLESLRRLIAACQRQGWSKEQTGAAFRVFGEMVKHGAMKRFDRADVLLRAEDRGIDRETIARALATVSKAPKVRARLRKELSEARSRRKAMTDEMYGPLLTECEALTSEQAALNQAQREFELESKSIGRALTAMENRIARTKAAPAPQKLRALRSRHEVAKARQGELADRSRALQRRAQALRARVVHLQAFDEHLGRIASATAAEASAPSTDASATPGDASGERADG